MVSAPPKPLPPANASARSAARTQERGAARLVDSAELMRGARELIIAHEGKHYRLQQTRNGKLILIK